MKDTSNERIQQQKLDISSKSKKIQELEDSLADNKEALAKKLMDSDNEKRKFEKEKKELTKELEERAHEVTDMTT